MHRPLFLGLSKKPKSGEKVRVEEIPELEEYLKGVDPIEGLVASNNWKTWQTITEVVNKQIRTQGLAKGVPLDLIPQYTVAEIRAFDKNMPGEFCRCGTLSQSIQTLNLV